MLRHRLGIACICVGLAAATAAAQTTRSRVPGAQLRPNTATVSVKQSVRLTVQVCDFDKAPDDDLQPIGYDCRDYPEDVTPILEQASVNGIIGGSAALGRVRVNGTSVYYIAPDRPPAPNPVTVSVAMTGRSAAGRPNKTVLLAEVRVVDDNKPPADPLPTQYSGSGKISFSTGTGASLLKYNATFQVAGGRSAGGGVGEYTLPGSVVVSDGALGLSNCECRITGGESTGEAGLGVDPAGKVQSLSVSAYVTVALSCAPSGGRRSCPASSVVAVSWSNRGRPDCPGSTETTFSDPYMLTGGYQRTCGNTQETATWTLTGEKTR